MHIERLERAAVILENFQETSDHRFRMHFWFNQCGTAGCAAGWIARDPWMNEQGLALRIQPSWGPYLVTFFQGHSALNALAAFFDLPHWQVARFFSPAEYPAMTPITPQMVARRMREVMGSCTQNV